ncbi:unnamed protein product [Camellia sinensis]
MDSRPPPPPLSSHSQPIRLHPSPSSATEPPIQRPLRSLLPTIDPASIPKTASKKERFEEKPAQRREVRSHGRAGETLDVVCADSTAGDWEVTGDFKNTSIFATIDRLYPPNDWLVGSSLPPKFSPTIIESTLNELTPNNVSKAIYKDPTDSKEVPPLDVPELLAFLVRQSGPFLDQFGVRRA